MLEIMIQNVKTNYSKNSTYVLRVLLIIFIGLSAFYIYNYSKNENVYLLYDDFANCDYVEADNKKSYYGICYKQKIILCEKKALKKIYSTKSIEKYNLTSKEDFFKIEQTKMKNIKFNTYNKGKRRIQDCAGSYY